MKIAINAVRVSGTGGGGMDHYVTSLVNHLAQSGTAFDLYTFSPHHFNCVNPSQIIHPFSSLKPCSNASCKKGASQQNTGFGGTGKPHVLRRRLAILFGDTVKMLWTQVVFPFILIFKRYDLVFSPSQIDVLPWTPFGTKQVISVLDIIPFILKGQNYKHMLFLKTIFPVALKNSSHVITISENTKKDVIRFFNIPQEKVTSVLLAKPGLAVSPEISAEEVSRIKAKFGLKRYILCVSSNHPHKNLSRLLQAYQLIEKNVNTSLLVAGYQDPVLQTGLNRIVKELGLENSVQFLGHVNSHELPILYAGSECFVFPSLYEGFGLPPLEAMAYGIPVAVSGISSLPEVVGEAGLYFDPMDPKDMAEKIRLLLTDGALRERLKKRSLERAKQFTWEKCARETIAVFEKVLGS